MAHIYQAVTTRSQHLIGAVLHTAALLALPACASLAGTHQVLSIDSPDRGLAVANEAGTVLGKTPLFVRVERESSHVLHYARAAGHRETFALQCHYRWLGSLLPNGVTASLSVANPPAALVVLALANGIDLWTGAAWHCPPAVLLPGALTPVDVATDASPSCHSFVIAPPQHEDDRISRQLSDLWWQHHGLATCHRLVSPDESDKILRRQGVTHATGLDITQRPREKLNELGLRTGASHLTVLQVRAVDDHIEATPTVYDLHTLAGTPGPPLTLDLAQSKLTLWQRVVQWTGRHVQLLPDSLGFAPSQKRFEFKPNAGNLFLDDQPTPAWLPALVSNWTLLSVDHPGSYQPWDATARLGPRVLFGYESRALRYGPDKAMGHKAEVTLLDLGALYGPTGTLHTPLGALSAFLGIGLAGAWHWHDGQFVAGRVPVMTSAGVAWTAFVTENLFVRGDISSYAATSPQVLGKGYQLETWSAVSLALGWHVPEWRQVVRGWF